MPNPALTPSENLTPVERFVRDWMAKVAPEDRLALAPCVHCCDCVPREATTCECGKNPQATSMTCPQCKGERGYYVELRTPWDQEWRECSECEGWGEVEPPCALERETWIRATGGEKRAPTEIAS